MKILGMRKRLNLNWKGKTVSELETANYREPYPQGALGGELGVTTFDIAKAMSMTHGNLMQRVNRFQKSEDIKNCAIFKAFYLQTHIEQAKKKVGYYSVNTNYAKYIVATTRNNAGIDYFSYLLACEKFTEEELPKLLEENQSLKDIISRQKHVKKIKSKGKTYIEQTSLVLKKGLFGFIGEKVTEKVLLSEARQDAKRSHILKHIQRVKKGLDKRIDQILSDSHIIPIEKNKLLTEEKNNDE